MYINYLLYEYSRAEQNSYGFWNFEKLVGFFFSSKSLQVGRFLIFHAKLHVLGWFFSYWIKKQNFFEIFLKLTPNLTIINGDFESNFEVLKLFQKSSKFKFKPSPPHHSHPPNPPHPPTPIHAPRLNRDYKRWYTLRIIVKWKWKWKWSDPFLVLWFLWNFYML